MNDLAELMSGKDWVITIRIPNHLLPKYPDKVKELQNTIQFALLKFNSEVKVSEDEKATIQKPNLFADGEVTNITEKQAIVSQMEKQKRDREGGGGMGKV